MESTEARLVRLALETVQAVLGLVEGTVQEDRCLEQLEMIVSSWRER